MATSDLFLFVSHVAENRVSAMEIVDELERRGTRCWIAPRDVRPGEPFDDEIAEAIETSRAMLLIFSDLCNDSQYIRREVTVAGESHKLVIPFRIEDVQPRKGLRVRLSDLHWIDGFTSRERAIDEVVKKFAPSTNGPVAPPLIDEDQQNTPKVQAEPKAAASSIDQSPPIIPVTTDVPAKEPITPPAKPKPVAAHDARRDIADTAATRDPQGHETVGPAGIARPLPMSPKEQGPKVKDETGSRTIPPARSNITFLQVVFVLLVSQVILHAYSVLFVLPWGMPAPIIYLLWCCGPIVVISFFRTASPKRWQRVLGWIAVGFGLIIDGLDVISEVSGLPYLLSMIIDIVVIIYLLRGNRPVPRAA